MKRVRWLIPAILATFLLVGCAANHAALSPKAKATMMLSTYNSIGQETKRMSYREDLTETQKEVVRKKKAALVKLDPLVKTYSRVALEGGIPSVEQEAAIYQLIDELVGLTP